MSSFTWTDDMDDCLGPAGPDTFPSTHRNFLRSSGGGFGMMALTALLAEKGLLAEEPLLAREPLAQKKPHHEPKAKRVIFLFMAGGPSHLETFDPKPELQRLHGHKLPESF